MEGKSSDHSTKRDGQRSLSKCRRKYYEEIAAERSKKKRAIETIAYNKVKKEFKKIQNDLRATVEVQKREIDGPPWYQELSFSQMGILNDLQDFIKKDFADSDTIRVRGALKDFGINTKIPHDVAREAIFYSKLYPIDFLRKIREYLCSKVSRKTVEPPEYTFEERIILSGIVHLGLPSLLMKLNYCLSDLIMGDNLKKNIRSKKLLPKKYLSPYLETFNSYGKSWKESEKTKSHNLNIKAQRKKRKLKDHIITNEQKKVPENILHDIEVKCKGSIPLHPLDAMFIKPPLDILFENEISDEILNSKEEIDEESKTNNDNSIQLISNNPSECSSECSMDVLNKNVSNTVGAATSIKSVVLNVSKTHIHSSKSRRSTLQDDSFSMYLSNISNLTNMSDLNLSDWQNFDVTQHARLKDPLDFTYEYDEVVEESEPDETVEEEDFLFLKEDQDENENFDDVISIKEMKKSFSESYFNVIVNSPSTEKLKNNELSQILKNSSMTKIMNGQSKTEARLIKMFNNEINAFPHYRLYSLGLNLTQSNNVQIFDSTKSILKERVNHIESKSNKSVPKASIELDFDEKSIPTKHKIQDDNSNQSKSTDKTHIYDEILTVLRTLSKWKQLKAVLEFLAILGDPVASLPEIIDLVALRHWYESRLNHHRPLGPGKKAKMLNTSMKLWEMPRPKIKDIPIPSIPCCEVTWDEKTIALKKIKETKDNYNKRIKDLVLLNTKNIFPTFKTIHYKSKLNREFKRLYHCYFPARENDFIFVRAPNAKEFKCKNDT